MSLDFMTEVTELSAWWFDKDNGAQRAVHRLEASVGGAPPIDDAGVVSWPLGRPRPLTWQAHDLGSEHRLSGAFWGLLFSSLFLLPLSVQDERPNCLAGNDRLTEGLESLGLSGTFLDSVRSGVRPGSSALFVLRPVDDDDPDLDLSPGQPCLARLYIGSAQRRRLHAGFDN